MASQLKAIFTLLGVFGLMVVFFVARQSAFLDYVDKLPVCEKNPDATERFVQGLTSQKPTCRASAVIAAPSLWPLR